MLSSSLNVGRRGGRNHHRVAADLQELTALHEDVEQSPLFLGDGVMQKFVDFTQVDAPLRLQQPGQRRGVAMGGGGVGQVAGVLVDAQRQQRGFHRLDKDAVFDDLLDQ